MKKRRPTPFFFLDCSWVQGADAWSNRELWTYGALCIYSALQGDNSGAVIPSVAGLARLAGLHRTTVAKALDDLVGRGIVKRARGDSMRFHFDRSLGRRGKSWLRVNWPPAVRRLRMAARRIYIQALRFRATQGLWAKQATIGLWAARSARQVRRHLAYLVKCGAIWRVRLGGMGYRRPTDLFRNLIHSPGIDPPQQLAELSREIRAHGDEDEVSAFDAAMKRAEALLA